MKIEDSDYCFLDAIYSNSDDESCLYEVTVSDSSFLDMSVYRVSLEELMKISNVAKLTDFSFQEGYLRCNANIARIPLNNIVLEHCENHNVNISSFYGLLATGARNNFLLISDPVEGSYNLENAVRFSAIKFSKSTMSIYAILHKDNDVYNRILLSLENGNIEFRPFYFAIPCANKNAEQRSDMKDCTFVTHITSHEKDYEIWFADKCSAYELSLLRSKSMINTAACLRDKISVAQAVLKSYLQALYSVLGYSNKTNSVWTGGTSSKESQFGVRFKTSIPHVTTEDRSSIMSLCYELRDNCNTFSEAASVLKSKHIKNSALSFAALHLLFVLYQSEDSELDGINTAIKVLNNLEMDLFFADLFLYRVRCNTYITHKHLVTPLEPYVTGGATSDYTVVEEGFLYES